MGIIDPCLVLKGISDDLNTPMFSDLVLDKTKRKVRKNL